MQTRGTTSKEGELHNHQDYISEPHELMDNTLFAKDIVYINTHTVSIFEDVVWEIKKLCKIAEIVSDIPPTLSDVIFAGI